MVLVRNQHAEKDNYGDYEFVLPGGLTDISGTQYDAATVNWGNGWRMPTKMELIELDDKTTAVWTSCNGVNGLRIIGPNGNSIFLPAAGYRNEYGSQAKGEYGYYRGSTIENENNPGYAYSYRWGRSYSGEAYNGVSIEWNPYGVTIRAVRD